ncbi:MAG: hypothetical protein GY854_23360 [Deltaproteobacteria bacterium]|nr:hypothetical protein [Deltaproteobacteria bacterium]
MIARLGRVSVVAFYILTICVLGCGGEEPREEEKKAVRRAAPTKKQGRPEPKRVKVKATPLAKGELFAAQIGKVSGAVKVRSYALDGTRGAKNQDQLFGGGTVTTGSDGGVVLAVRDVGTAVLGKETHLIISPYSGSGAVLVRGNLSLAGPPKTVKKSPGYLHTPATAVLAKVGAKATVSVADDGRTQVIVLTGEVVCIDLEDKQRKLSKGEESTFDATKEPNAALDAMLTRAEKVANRLELDVGRLVELMEQNKKASAERSSITKGEVGAEAKIRDVTSRLVEQSREMVEHREKGMLQIQRIVALTELVTLHKPMDSSLKDRTATLRDRLEAMKTKLPPLFDRPKTKK